MGLSATDMSPADIAAVTGNRGGGFDGFGENGAWWIIILFLFAFCGWGGNGFGGGGAQGAANNYVLASDFATLQRQLSDGFGGQERRTDAIVNGLCDGFYAQAQLVNGVNTNLAQQGYETRNAITQAQISAMQNANAIQTQIAGCCCDVREGIQGVNYNLATQACGLGNQVNNSARDIVDNQNANTRAILEALNRQELAAKDAKIAEQSQMINGLQLAASQSAQNAYLINQLRPCPVPAYNVPNPFAGCGCGCG